MRASNLAFNFLWTPILLSLLNVNYISAIQKNELNAKVCGKIICSFQHMEFDIGQGKLYVGGINKIYQLSKDLELERVAITGPEEDSEECYPHSTCKKPMKLTDNINKLLVLDTVDDRILACGSIKQGTCDLRKLGNVTKVLNDFDGKPDPRNDDFVASTRTDHTTVAFVAEEGINGKEKSLYVGSSRTQQDSKLISDEEQFPTFVSRRLPSNSMDKDMLSSDLGTKQSSGLLTKKELASKGFRVNFVSAFAATDNGYFVLTYPDIVRGSTVRKDKVKSYIAQVCMRGNDGKPVTNSYLEIPIAAHTWITGRETSLTRVVASTTAKVGTSLDNALSIPDDIGLGNPDVLFVSFATEGDNVGGSAVALFPMYEIDNLYYSMVESCFEGREMPHVEWQREGEIPCKMIDYPLKSPLCSNAIWDIVGLYQSINTKFGYTVFESNNTIITSIAVAKQGEHTVAFMGTEDGRLLKLKVDSKPSGNRDLLQPYEEVQIDSDSSEDNYIWKNMGNPSILSDMRLDNERTRLFIMSERKIVSLPLHNCEKFTTCYDCLNAGDPFCGWCTLDNKCTPSSECQMGKYYYATSVPANCPKLTGTDPAAIHVSSESELITVSMSHVPQPEDDGHYYCVFGDNKVRKSATYGESKLQCMSPSSDDVPPLQGKEIHLPLSLHYVRDGVSTAIASTDVIYYNCNFFHSCLQCHSSRAYRCHWCVGDNACIKSSRNCKTYPGDLKNSLRCPYLQSVTGTQYIHENTRHTVDLEVRNLNELQQPRFSCKFTIEGLRTHTVNATETRDGVSCSSVQGFLPSDKFESKARVDVYWENHLIDNPKNLNVTMYRCSRGEEDSCGKCLLLDQDLKCGWCETQNKCMLCDDCTGSTCHTESGVYRGWLDEAQVCTHPKITKFYPESAASGGTTIITLEGINFGKIFRGDIEEVRVRVAGVKCNLVKEGSKQSEKIVCKVQNLDGDKVGPVELCILDYSGNCRGLEYRDKSTKQFRFITPNLTHFTPPSGLSKGGTTITITGEHLNIGNSVSVRIDDRDCPVIKSSITDTEFKCKLQCEGGSKRRRRRSPRTKHPFSRLPSSRRHRLKRAEEFAAVEVYFDEKKFSFRDVFKLEGDLPENLKLDRHESIKSGGMKIVVSGTNLGLTQELVLVAKMDAHSVSKKCEGAVPGVKTRTCYTPALKGHHLGNYTASLTFDGCLTKDVGVIRYTGDPYLEMLKEDQIHSNGPIIISGQNLCPNPVNCDADSASVRIGKDLKCNVTSLDKDKLMCMPPEDASGKHAVLVAIGSYTQKVGQIQFESNFGKELKIIIPIAVVCIIVIAIAVVYYLRARNKMEMVRQEQMRYDMMEAKVAKECREAFAELQTDMQSDLDNIGTVGIPFRPRQDYIMRVLFPDPEMHEKLKNFVPTTTFLGGQNRFNQSSRNGGRDHRMLNAALDDFNQLIENKTFLLSFIHAIEKHKRFTMKDRSNVAGLLMIVLQDRLEYATRILEELLSELIRDVVESRGNPKLLLRRSESVAEKLLTHWFSVLLHGFLEECAGEHLFTLYRAIRAQLDKGPVDAITEFAKYSLNQDKLLRQAINYEQLTLIVVDNDHPGRDLSVRVLDCDTITQVKEKIIALRYRNLPQSQHPSADAFELEIKSEPLGGVPLSDEDNTSITEGNWRRLNTLLHYKVDDKSIVSMVPKRRNQQLNQTPNSNQSFASRVSGMVYNGSGHRLIADGGASLPRHFGGGSQDTRSSTPTQVDDGKKPYHLMKVHDNEPRDGTGTAGSLMVSEIYFTRLLATKGTFQKFVNDLFETIFSVVQRGHALPLAIKHMFDFFDEQAEYYGITDTDIVHTWKSNSLPLRFWVNLIKNPEFLFDIKKSGLVDSCLSVIAGAFMDSCSTSDQNLGKDSPSGKLLYAKEVQNYKRWVVNYYDEISAMDHLGPQDMQCFLKDESAVHGRNNSIGQAALTELFVYVQKYNAEVIEALNSDPSARNQKLAQRLEQLSTTMTSTV